MININDQLLFHLSNLNKENLRIAHQTSTGDILQNGSDDTAVFSKVLYLEDKLRVYGGVQSQLEQANIYNDFSDSSLASVKLSLDAIKNTHMIASLNAGTDQSAKKAIATAIEGLKNDIFDRANTNINNEYVFAGSDSTIQPFIKDENGRIIYVGDNTLKETPVEPDSYRDRGTTGFDAFMYTTDTARAGDQLEFSENERIVDTNGNTWGFPDSIETGEKLDLFATDTIMDSDGQAWTVNTLDSTLENTSGTPPVTTSIDLVKFNGGYQFKDNLADGATNAAGNPVTSFTTAPAGGATSEIRQYDKYGNLTGEVLGVTATAAIPPATEIRYTTAALPTDSSLTLETKHNMFDDLDIIITALNGVDADGNTITEEVQNDIVRGMLDKMTSMSDAVGIAHSQVGSRHRIMLDAEVTISSKISNFDILAIQTGRADITALALEAQELQITYTAMYSTIARMQNLNLVNFLN